MLSMHGNLEKLGEDDKVTVKWNIGMSHRHSLQLNIWFIGVQALALLTIVFAVELAISSDAVEVKDWKHYFCTSLLSAMLYLTCLLLHVLWRNDFIVPVVLKRV